MLSLKL